MTTECHSLLQLPPDVLTEVLRMLVTDVTVVSLLRSCTTFRNLIVGSLLVLIPDCCRLRPNFSSPKNHCS